MGISYGIYDPANNRGTVCVGVSHDTAAFAAHSIATGWKHKGALLHGTAPKLLILADAGGSNNCRSWAWKTEIQTQLCNQFGITITVAHYPTGASKWNPIEHRLYSQVSRNWRADRWIPIRRSSTMPAPHKPKPEFGSQPISTAETIPAVSNPHRIKLLPFDYSDSVT